MPIKNRFAELHPEITAWRRDMHAHPELLYDTHRTADLVARKLRDFGCDEVVPGIGQTGVVGVIKGRTDTRGHVVGIRADMDALPILEATGAAYASTIPGKMHACGHDGHTSMVLGAAQYLAATRNFDGRVAVIFQPAEEGGAGAKAMIDDGLIERFAIKEIYGMHNLPGLAVGEFAIRPGPFYAATDEFNITLTGKGGHAAVPQMTVDPTVMGANIVMSLQSIVSRNIDPVESVVVSVSSFRTDSDTHNVIPQEVVLRGTVRSFDPDLRRLAEDRLKTIVEQTAAAYGGKAWVDWMRGYPALINSETETAYAAEAARKVAGTVDDMSAPTLGGEDFAYMLEVCPGAYIHMGNGDSAECHHPEYDFDDEAIPAGCSFWVELVEARMPV